MYNTEPTTTLLHRSKLGWILLIIILAIITSSAILLVKSVKSAKNTTLKAPVAESTAKDPRIDIQQPKSNFPINKDFSFPFKDESGKEAGKIIYRLENAELRDEIVVKGQRATAIYGRTFLILNIKLKNEGSKSVQINTRDFVRLSVNGSPDWLAPDIHNDPVEVLSISTKYTRLGFPINDSDKDLKLQVGEINGEKTTVNLSFN